MFSFIVILSTIASIARLRRIMTLDGRLVHRVREDLTDGTSWGGLGSYYTWFINQYAAPITQFTISLVYAIYIRLTFLNIVIFVLKYVPLTIYVYKFMKNLYKAPRERIKRKQIELEDIQLQIEIVNTKLCVRDAEFSERQEHLRRGAERLRRVRSRVREIIATDETLRRALENPASIETDLPVQSSPQEEREFILESLKELKCDQVAIPERLSEKMECGETLPTESNINDDSVYSLLNDVDFRQDCRVKIVKVTNVYKVAYLKHYIKQKRLRRVSKQALLKKKMECVKKLLEDWQKALNMVLNSKLPILDMERHHMDDASQEAMGDYSKPNEPSDSDSDLRNSSSDAYYDEYSLRWAQNPYRPYSYSYEDGPEPIVSRDYDYDDFNDVKYPPQCEDVYQRYSNMVAILEETNSQLAIQQMEDSDCHNYNET